jgi:hypothetical protein
MSNTVYLTLLNPTPKARGGPVVTRWKPIAERGSLGPHVKVFFDGREIDAQVDRLDPNDPSHDELVFRLPDQALSPGDFDYKKPDDRKASADRSPANGSESAERCFGRLSQHGERVACEEGAS